MISSRLSILVSFFSIILLASCQQERSKSITKSTGKTAEILVVINDLEWEGPVGNKLRESLQNDMGFMPQPEPRFVLVNIPHKVFTDLYQKHHKIIMVEIDARLDSAMIQTKSDYWASPQEFIRMRASTEEELIEAYQKRAQGIREILERAERRRLINLYQQMNDLNIRNQIRDNFGISLLIPNGFYVAKMSSDFAWLRKETKDFSQGLLIYTTTYSDTSLFSNQLIVNRRNQLTRIHIPGNAPESFMITSPFVEPLSETIYFNDHFAVRTYGLWDVQGDFMGGPFLNYAILDEKRNQILSLDSYIYYPNNDKRDLMLQMEAVMYTLEMDK